MKTAIIGGGRGCRDILELALEGRLKTISLNVLCVVDPSPEAPGAVYARGHNITTLSEMEPAIRLPGLDLILEVTGRDDILERIYQLVPPGVRVMDHMLARVFWDVEQAEHRLRDQLRKSLELEWQIERDRRELQEILDAMPDVVMVINKDRRIDRVNARFEQMTGIGREEAHGMLCKEAFCGSGDFQRCREGNLCSFDEVLAKDGPVVSIHLGGRRDGDESYSEVTANPIRDGEGEVIQIVETFRPITEQVLLKRETEESERRFRQFLDATHDVIVMKDMAGRYLYINQRAAEMAGRQPEDFEGRTDFELLPGKIARRMLERDREAMEEKRHVAREEKLVIGGREYYLETVRFPLYDYKGDVIGVSSISRDITEQKQLQSELLQSERLAAVGKLAAGVAHEINNPLTGILTFAESLLLEAEEDDPAREDYEVIIRETMRCRRIVRDLLDYARLEKPKRELSDLNRLVERSVSMVEKQADFHDVKIERDFLIALPEVSVDPNQIQQVILNLVINAKDAMKKVGTISLKTGVDESGNKVTLEISDDGPGIPPRDRKRIFEPFYTTKGAEGNGLGLPVVLNIIEQHGGKVSVDESEMGGALFRITLPSAKAAQPEE